MRLHCRTAQPRQCRRIQLCASSAPGKKLAGMDSAIRRSVASILAAVWLAVEPVPAATVPAMAASDSTILLPGTSTEGKIVQPDLPEAAPVDLPPLPTEFPPLPEIKLPLIEQVTLSNGLRVFFAEDHELPLVKGTLFMRGGQRAVPASALGVGTLAAAVQRAGGSTTLPGDDLDAALEQLAAYIEGGAGGEAVSFGFGCASEDTEAVISMFSDVITSPALPQQRIDRLKSQAINALSHKDDNPSGIPARELAKLLYGRDSVFARNPTQAQVARLQRSDVVSFLDAWERPDSSVLGISGDFDTAAIKGILGRTLATWQVAPGQPPEPMQAPNPPLPPNEFAGQVLLIDRPGLTQASVAIGQAGVSLRDPDAIGLDVMSSVLNGFGGRLFNEIRSREGLAYSVSGGWNTSHVDHVGLFVAGGETAAPAQLLSAMRTVLQEARDEVPTDEEVAVAQEETVNSFVFNFASTTSQLQRRLVYDVIGLPADYLFQYRESIEAVTPQQVAAATRRHLQPDELTTIVIADAKVFKPQLEALGQPVRLWTVQE